MVAEPGSLPRTVVPSRTLLQLRHDLLLGRDSDCPGVRCSATIRRDSFSTGQYSGSRFQILRVSPRNSLVLFPLLSCLPRSEEHTSELQSLTNLVCRLL